MAGLSIQELLGEKEAGLDLELLAGERGLGNCVQVPRIQKPGLALAGYTTNLHPDRIQVLGSTELSYLNHLPPEKAATNLRRFCALNVSCFIITKGQEPPDRLVMEAEQQGIPLLRTHHQSSTFISLITQFLEERLLPSTTVHGVLVDVLGVGVLLLGKSGIGKSECALDLVLKGHRLVADDVVKVRMKLPAVLFGEGMDLLHYHMEIRGLGIINIKHLFGVAAIRERKKIDVAVELLEWEDGKEYDRLGLEEQKYSILDPAAISRRSSKWRRAINCSRKWVITAPSNSRTGWKSGWRKWRTCTLTPLSGIILNEPETGIRSHRPVRFRKDRRRPCP
jgi:HPr kinase/phosphorylase